MKQKLLSACEEKDKMKTKTMHIAKLLQDDKYLQNHYQNVIFDLPRHSVRTIIMARYGMLDCANNYKGKYGTKICTTCNVIDNESHRINDCRKWKDINLFGKDLVINFDAVYSEDLNTLKQISNLLQSIWNLENNKNEMRQ